MINDSEQKAIEELKKDLDIEIKECSSSNDYRHLSGLYLNGNVETILNLISKLQSDIEIKDKVIDEVTKEIEILRQYFDESSQPDFIRILEILRK